MSLTLKGQDEGESKIAPIGISCLHHPTIHIDKRNF